MESKHIGNRTKWFIMLIVVATKAGLCKDKKTENGYKNWYCFWYYFSLKIILKSKIYRKNERN